MDSKSHFSLLHCWFPNTAARQKYPEGFVDNTVATFFPFVFLPPSQNPWILSRARVVRHICAQTGPGACPSTPWFCLLWAHSPAVLRKSSPGSHLALCICPSRILCRQPFLWLVHAALILPVPDRMSSSQTILAIATPSPTHRLSTRAPQPSHPRHFKISDARRLILLVWVSRGHQRYQKQRRMWITAPPRPLCRVHTSLCVCHLCLH